MRKRPTLKTIGQMAGLSHVAVSKALRDAPDISAAIILSRMWNNWRVR